MNFITIFYSYAFIIIIFSIFNITYKIKIYFIIIKMFCASFGWYAFSYPFTLNTWVLEPKRYVCPNMTTVLN